MAAGTLVKCHAGCELHDVLGAMGLEGRDMFPDREANAEAPAQISHIAEVYPYTDESGRTLYEVVRLDPKGFRQRHRDHRGGYVWILDRIRRVIYRLPAVLKAAASKGIVYVVEGEKDVHALESLGLVATTNAGGAGKWREGYTASLKGCRGVVILPDNDEPR